MEKEKHTKGGGGRKLALPEAQTQTDHHNYEVLLFADLGGCISFVELSNQQIPVTTHEKTLNFVC